MRKRGKAFLMLAALLSGGLISAGWGTRETHPFTCGVREIAAEEGGWSLIPEQFPDKYFYIRSMRAECAAHPELSFQ